MQILIDSREQAPLEFESPTITETPKVALKVGDYGCRYKNGYEPPVYFERKSIADLFSTLGGGYPRFKRELLRAKDNAYHLILIVEGSIGKVLKGAKYSSMAGSSILKKMFTLWIKYDLIPVFCKDREEMSRFIIEYYEAIGRKAMTDLKEKKGT